MIRHIALFTFSSSWAPERVAEMSSAISSLPDSVSSIVRAQCGPSLAWQQGCDYAMELDFADRSGFDHYKGSEAHRRLIEDHIGPLVESTARIQIELKAE